MASYKGRRLVGAIIVLIGAVLLVSTVFVPWYSYQSKNTAPGGRTGTITLNSYPGFLDENGTIQCSSTGGIAPPCPYSQTSYQEANYNNTGAIAETGFVLLAAGFLLGLVGALLGLVYRGNARRVAPAIILTAIAVILAVVAPVLFMAQLPGAQSNDIPAYHRPTSSGPWSSFFGSTSLTAPSGITENFSWGPGLGWYLSFAAFAILLVGLILLLRYRKDPPEPAPVSTPSPAPAAATPQTTKTSP